MLLILTRPGSRFLKFGTESETAPRARL